MRSLHGIIFSLVLGTAVPAQGKLVLDLPATQLSVFGLAFSADYAGPPMATITGARARLDYTTSTLDAANLVILVQAPSSGLPVWKLRGASLGWSGTGHFTANVTTSALNGPIDLGWPLPLASLVLVRLYAEPMQPLGGQLRMSTIELDLSPWTDLGGGGAGSGGMVPHLAGSGALVAGGAVRLDLSHARPGAASVLVLGSARAQTPLLGHLLVPSLDAVVAAPTVSPGGGWSLGLTWPAAVPAGATLFLQAWVLDPQGVQGLASSNGVGVLAP